jgi:hypothetical protein
MQVLSSNDMDQVAGGDWAGVALGAGALSTAAFSAAAFPGTWTVPFAGGALVATGAVTAGIGLMAGYFSTM